ncbi:MATE family efflux transporter [Sphaerothrix gracilis]|uniref:MATE family efflux transporter n=1 Tax=Sphaerothrix gracilis TaxID=3151835 RepID=UPI0031FDCC29
MGELETPLWSRFWRLAVVNVLSNLMVPLAGLVDSAFLGHLSAIRFLAGVAIATALFNYLYRPCNFLRMGTTGPTAQVLAIAATDSNSRDSPSASLAAEANAPRLPDEVLLILLRNGLIALLLGALLLLLQVPLRELGFRLFEVTPQVEAAGRSYFQARIWDAPATLLNFVLLGWFLGREQGGRVLLLSALSNGANVVLDYLLIVRWGWQSLGAGVATAMSQYLMLAVGLALVLADVPLRRWAIASQVFHRQALTQTLRLNTNIWLRSVLFITVYALFTGWSAALGTTTLAANMLLLQVVILAVYFIDGLAFATESIAGSLYGAKTSDRLLPLLQLAGGTGLVLGVSIAVIFTLFPGSLFALLTNHTEIVAHIAHDVLWLLPVLGFGSLAFVLDGYFLGLANGIILRNSMAAAAVFGFVPLAIASWRLETNGLLWAAMATFMLTRAVILGTQVPRSISELDDYGDSPLAANIDQSSDLEGSTEG